MTHHGHLLAHVIGRPLNTERASITGCFGVLLKEMPVGEGKGGEEAKGEVEGGTSGDGGDKAVDCRPEAR